jgi:methylenetetrahydromethanopterin dehydrogenase
MPGPAKAREKLSSSGLPSVVITDEPGKRVKAELESQGLGYIIITGDPLIGARKEFLDPIEMAIFNSNINKVLAITGAYRIIHQEIDKVIYALEAGQSPTVPRLIIDVNSIRDNSDFSNPYARAKAMAAYALTEKIAEINAQACFIEKESKNYIPLVACAHEIAQIAARLAEEAREIEKYNDSLMRKPHAKDGKTKIKTKLMAPPTSDEEFC